MVDIIVAIGVGILIGAFGVIAWCLRESEKNKRGIGYMIRMPEIRKAKHFMIQGNGS